MPEFFLSSRFETVAISERVLVCVAGQYGSSAWRVCYGTFTVLWMRRSDRRCAIFHATERPRTMPAPAVGNAFPTADAASPSCIAIFSYAALFRFDDGRSRCYDQTAGWSSLVARWAHNPKVGGSNPPPATNAIIELRAIGHLQQLSKTVQ